MSLPWDSFAARLALALLLGAAIGLERQYRRHVAGLQTNALVSSGAALYVLLGVSLPLRTEDLRIAGQIVTGIGFLGSGIIIRDGLHVRGLNTAATLWCAAAIGALAGYGLFWQAGLGALAVLAVNTLLHAASHRLDRSRGGFAGLDFHYRLIWTVAKQRETSTREQLLAAVQSRGLCLQAVETRPGEGGTVALQADVYSPEPLDAELLRLAEAAGDGVARWERVLAP
ncbi:MAG: MgtC/SapB family protein [Acidobacteria bacterium]|nr:MgtC/SapB family protein [Acidobacteriota bacterium]